MRRGGVPAGCMAEHQPRKLIVFSQGECGGARASVPQPLFELRKLVPAGAACFGDGFAN
jgi:hypothetical protein